MHPLSRINFFFCALVRDQVQKLLVTISAGSENLVWQVDEKDALKLHDTRVLLDYLLYFSLVSSDEIALLRLCLDFMLFCIVFIYWYLRDVTLHGQRLRYCQLLLLWTRLFLLLRFLSLKGFLWLRLQDLFNLSWVAKHRSFFLFLSFVCTIPIHSCVVQGHLSRFTQSFAQLDRLHFRRFRLCDSVDVQEGIDLTC